MINKKKKVIDLIRLILFHISCFCIVPLIIISLPFINVSLLSPKTIYETDKSIFIFNLILAILLILYYYINTIFWARNKRNEYKDKYFNYDIYDDNIIGYHDYISRADALNMIKEYKKDINDHTDDLYTPYDKCLEAIINTPAIKNNINDGKNKVYINKEEVKDIINKNWFFNIISRRCAEELLNEIDRLEYHTIDQEINWKVCAVDGDPKENCGCLVKIINTSDKKILYGYRIAEYDVDLKRWFKYGISSDDWKIIEWSPLPKANESQNNKIYNEEEN